MAPLTALARLAARQHHVVDRADLDSLGFSDDAIDWLVDTERLFRIHRGVFAFGRPDLIAEGRWMAAVLACSAPAALSHLSAAVFRELLQHERERPDVIVPAGLSNRGPKEISLHRSSDITEEDVEVVDGIRVTTVLRILIDLSRSRLPTHSLNAAVRQAAKRHHADLQRLRGYKRLDPIVRLFDPLINLTESELEARFFELCRVYGLPAPAPQVRFVRRRADFTFEHARLVIECDSREWHDNDFSFLDDRRKERFIKSRGYMLLRFTWAEIVYEPARVALEIKAVLGQRARLRA